MASDAKFTEYRAMVSDLASRGLSAIETPSPERREGLQAPPADSLLLAAPAARILLRDDPAHHAGLVRAMRTLADLGRPWLRVGVNVGTLAEAVDDPQRLAAQNHVDKILRNYAREAHQPHTRVPIGFPIALRDSAGHARDVYHPFAVHLCLAAFDRCYETLPQPMWAACEQAVLEMVAPLRFIEYFADAPPPPQLTPLVLWQALGLAEQSALLSRDIDLEVVDVVVQAIISLPSFEGRGSARDSDGETSQVGASAHPLHPQLDDDSPEAWTYRELTALHALANLALKRRNNTWAKCVEQAALYHLEHTQPDNTTNQPWALFAFLWSPATRTFADQQLHDLTAHTAPGSSAPSPTATLLLADAASALTQFG